MAGSSFAASRETGSRALALASFAVFAAFLLLIGSIAYFGRPSDGEPVTRIELSPHAPLLCERWRKRPQRPLRIRQPSMRHCPPQRRSPSTPLPPQIVPATVDKPVYRRTRAGRRSGADRDKHRTAPCRASPTDGRTPMARLCAALRRQRPAAHRHRRSAVSASAPKQTAAAIERLPAGVTLAFAPYADDVQRWVGEARSAATKCCSKCRWSRIDFPDSDPGPHTLRAASSEDTNTERLVWSLTRFTGYAGVTNLLGGRFLADSDSLEPVMTFLARRGLLFFDSGSAQHSAAPDVAQQYQRALCPGTHRRSTRSRPAWRSTRGSRELEARARAERQRRGDGVPLSGDHRPGRQLGQGSCRAGALFWCRLRP